MKNYITILCALILTTSNAFNGRDATKHIGIGIITDASMLITETDYTEPVQGFMSFSDFNIPVAKHTDLHTSLFWHILTNDIKASFRGGLDLGFAIYDNHNTTGSSTLIIALSPYVYKPTYDIMFLDQYLPQSYKLQLGTTFGSDLKLNENLMLRSRFTLFPENDSNNKLLVSSSIKYAIE